MSRGIGIVRGGAPVRVLRWYLILIILGLSSSAAMADSTDPALGVKGGTGSTLWTGSTTFTIDNDIDGNTFSGVFFIDTGMITNFEFSFNENQVTVFSALAAEAGNIFPTVMTILPGFEAILSGGTIFPADPPAASDPVLFGDFQLVVNGGLDGSVVTVTSNVPEPGTMILMLSGLGVLGLRRLRRKKVAS